MDTKGPEPYGRTYGRTYVHVPEDQRTSESPAVGSSGSWEQLGMIRGSRGTSAECWGKGSPQEFYGMSGKLHSGGECEAAPEV